MIFHINFFNHYDLDIVTFYKLVKKQLRDMYEVAIINCNCNKLNLFLCKKCNFKYLMECRFKKIKLISIRLKFYTS